MKEHILIEKQDKACEQAAYTGDRCKVHPGMEALSFYYEHEELVDGLMSFYRFRYQTFFFLPFFEMCLKELEMYEWEELRDDMIDNHFIIMHPDNNRHYQLHPNVIKAIKEKEEKKEEEKWKKTTDELNKKSKWPIALFGSAILIVIFYLVFG